MDAKVNTSGLASTAQNITGYVSKARIDNGSTPHLYGENQLTLTTYKKLDNRKVSGSLEKLIADISANLRSLPTKENREEIRTSLTGIIDEYKKCDDPQTLTKKEQELYSAALAYMGNLQIESNEIKEAVENYRMASEISDIDGQPSYFLGKLSLSTGIECIKEGRNEDGEKLLEASRSYFKKSNDSAQKQEKKYNPGSLISLMYLELKDIFNEDYVFIIGQLEDMIAEYPDDERINLNYHLGKFFEKGYLGDEYKGMNKNDKAEEIFEGILDKIPANNYMRGKTLGSLGVLNSLKKNFVRAKGYLIEAVKNGYVNSTKVWKYLYYVQQKHDRHEVGPNHESFDVEKELNIKKENLKELGKVEVEKVDDEVKSKPIKLPGRFKGALARTILSPQKITAERRQELFEEEKDIVNPLNLNSFFIQSSCGVNLNCYLHKNTSNKCIIFLPGLGGPNDLSLPFMRTLSENDTNVAMINYSGTGAEEGKMSEQAMLLDAEDILKEIMTKFERKNIILYGHCAGCALALHLANLFPKGETFGGIILDAPAPNIPLLLRRQASLYEKYFGGYIGAAIVSSVAEFDCIKRGKQINKDEKVLVLQGDLDTVSVPQNAKDVFNAINANKQMIHFPKGTHATMGDRYLFFKILDRFIHRKILFAEEKYKNLMDFDWTEFPTVEEVGQKIIFRDNKGHSFAVMPARTRCVNSILINKTFLRSRIRFSYNLKHIQMIDNEVISALNPIPECLKFLFEKEGPIGIVDVTDTVQGRF